MVFSSLEFLFFYLPIAMLGAFILRKSIWAQNFFLFNMSLVFYAWGEPKLVVLFIVTILLNWSCGLFADRKPWIGKLAIAIDIGILFVFKYMNWIVDCTNRFFNTAIIVPQLVLPIGISFYTFQAISYVADVLNNRVIAQKNPVNLGLYIAFFPQLIAGPIVRYTEIEKQIEDRHVDYLIFREGVIRFLMGFSKKVILADSMALIVDKAYSLLDRGLLGASFAWLGAFAYTFQIFLDFSAYSDMAIGLGKMFGFSIPENFNKPYIAKSIRDFWRRWHISLSVWFRDYVYIPLGGNRKGSRRTYYNVATVWFLTGLWHGASENFLVWGCVYGVLVVTENVIHIDALLEHSSIFAFVYRLFTFFSIVLLWVVFRSNNIHIAIQYIKAMFNFGIENIGKDSPWMYLWELKYELIASALISWGCLPVKVTESKLYGIIKSFLPFVFFVIGISYLVKGSFSPFLYFNF